MAAQGRAYRLSAARRWDQVRQVRRLLPPGGWGNGDRVGMWEVPWLVLGWFAYCADLLFFWQIGYAGYELNYLDKVRLPETQNVIRDKKFRFRSR